MSSAPTPDYGAPDIPITSPRKDHPVTDRHNIAAPDAMADLPAPFDADAGHLGDAIERLAALAPELAAPAGTEDLRITQYRRAAEYGRWIAEAATDLETELKR